MSTISASTTSTTAYKVTADTTGALVLQTGATPTTAVTIDTSQNVLIGGASAQTGAVLAVTGGIQGTIKSGTAVASTSGTSIDFTGIPSWVKRITVMFSGVSTSGTNPLLIQGGNSGGIVNTGYNSTSNHFNQSAGTSGSSSTAGFIFFNNTATYTHSGIITLANVSGSTWVSSHNAKSATTLVVVGGGDGSITSLDRIRITTTTAVDTFDAGTINILYEG